MTDERAAEETAPEPADLEYDLAHEQVTGAGGATDAAHKDPEKDREKDNVYVATETSGYDGDYEYDLAHDVPGR